MTREFSNMQQQMSDVWGVVSANQSAVHDMKNIPPPHGPYHGPTILLTGNIPWWGEFIFCQLINKYRFQCYFFYLKKYKNHIL